MQWSPKHWGYWTLEGRELLNHPCFGADSFDRAMQLSNKSEIYPQQMVGFMERTIINHWMLGYPMTLKQSRNCYVCFSEIVFVETWLMLAGLGYHGGNSIGNGVKLCSYALLEHSLRSLQLLCSDGCRFPIQRFSLQVYSALFFILKDEPGNILVLAEAPRGCCGCWGVRRIWRYLYSPSASTATSLCSELFQSPL